MTTTEKKRGFAALSPEKIREIARKGGKAVAAAGNGHKFTPEEARIAGSKGGRAVQAKRQTRDERDVSLAKTVFKKFDEHIETPPELEAKLLAQAERGAAPDHDPGNGDETNGLGSDFGTGNE